MKGQSGLMIHNEKGQGFMLALPALLKAAFHPYVNNKCLCFDYDACWYRNIAILNELFPPDC